MSIAAFIRILLARRFLIAATLFAALIIVSVISLSLPKKYRAASDLIIQSNEQDPISGFTMQAQQLRTHMKTQADVITSQMVNKRAVEILLEKHKDYISNLFNASSGPHVDIEHWLSRTLQNTLEVIPQRESSILSIIVESQYNDFTAMAANAVAESYIQTNLDLTIEPAKRISNWYEKQLAELRNQLELAQTQLSTYQEEHGIISVDEKLDIETSRLKELSTLLINTQSQRFTSQGRNNQLEGNDNNQLSADVLSNPLILSLKEDLNRAQTNLDEIATRVGVNHPQYIQAKQEVEALGNRLSRTRELVGSSIKSNTKLLEEMERQLTDALTNQKNKVLMLNRKRNELSLLEQEVKNAQNIYEATMAKATQAQLESQRSLTNILILNEALVPSRPYGPKVAVNIFVGAFLGLFLGIFIALLLEWSKKVIRHKEELEQITGMPVLGYIPTQGHLTSSRLTGLLILDKFLGG